MSDTVTLPSWNSGSGSSQGSSNSIYTPPDGPHLPKVVWAPDPPKVIQPASITHLTATATRPIQAPTAAINQPIRITYGKDRLTGSNAVGDILVHNGNLVMYVIWGYGPYAGIDRVWMNDAALPANVGATHYLGTAGQTADPTLVAAYAANGITYDDALPNIVYSVFSVPGGAASGVPSFAALIRGRLLYDPRTGLTGYSDNPSLALGDFLASPVYGYNKPVDWDSVTVAANANDELVGTSTEKRRIIGLTLDSIKTVEAWTETLRTYAGCYVVPGQAGMKLVPDRPGTSQFSFDETNIRSGTFKWIKKGAGALPNVLIGNYTDTTVTPWAQRPVVATEAGIAEGSAEARTQQVQLKGIQLLGQATREVTERLNHYALEDFSCTFETFDTALSLEGGEIVDVTFGSAIIAKECRIEPPVPIEPGRYRITLKEYDPATYSDTVVANPTYPDTVLPLPTDPPALASGSVSVVEENYIMQDGTNSTRLAISWSASDWPFVDHYVVNVFANNQLISTAPVTGTSYRTGPVQQGVQYVVQVAIVSGIPVVGPFEQINITAEGNLLPPDKTASFTAFEAGGTVYMSWSESLAVGPRRFELRWGPVGGVWDAATVINKVDALKDQTSMIPVGTFVLYNKTINGAGIYSSTAATTNVTVTTDANSFLADSQDETTPTLTNMVSYTLGPDDPRLFAVTEDGGAFDNKFSGAFDTYANPLCSYCSTTSAEALFEALDFGEDLAGQWTGTATVYPVTGTTTSFMGFSHDDINWTYLPGLSQKADARFARLDHRSTGVFCIQIPAQNIRVAAIPRTEKKSGTSSATAGVLVQLSGTYIGATSVSVNPQGGTAMIGVPDRVLVAPVQGLCMQSTSTSSGTENSNVYWIISDLGGRVILADDYLEYDYFDAGAPIGATFGISGVELYFTDGTYGRSYPLIDTLGNDDIWPIPSFGQWTSRKISLAPVAAKTVSAFTLVRESDLPGDYKTIYRNIRITDGAGTTRLTIWSTGEPPINSELQVYLSTNIQCGPANSFLANVFDTNGGRVVSNFLSIFSGV